jgi:hypothetical protein
VTGQDVGMAPTSADEQNQLDGASARLPRRTLFLLILGGVASISLIFTPPGIPALVIGIVAATSWRRHPERSRKLTTIGYAVFAGVVLVQIVVTVLDLGSRS